MGCGLVSQIDYCTGYMGAYAVLLGLIERQQAAVQGKATAGVVVRTSLCQAPVMSKLGARAPAASNGSVASRGCSGAATSSQTVSTSRTSSDCRRASITPPQRPLDGGRRDAPTDDLWWRRPSRKPGRGGGGRLCAVSAVWSSRAVSSVHVSGGQQAGRWSGVSHW